MKPSERPSDWTKSSYSNQDGGGACIEYRTTTSTVQVRDSKNPHGARLTLTAAGWAGLVSFARNADA
ncbi:DUF397 domain-containing protein [Streptomyces sp. NPDC059080]|uniref:DUF397 domain-containing protein n=1 Tax=Streptomyces sp. NPDC059080 TaxID=3346718 RepID=UPI0036747AE6